MSSQVAHRSVEQPIGFADPGIGSLADYQASNRSGSEAPSAPPTTYDIAGEAGKPLDEIAPAAQTPRNPGEPFETAGGSTTETEFDPRQPFNTARTSSPESESAQLESLPPPTNMTAVSTTPPPAAAVRPPAHVGYAPQQPPQQPYAAPAYPGLPQAYAPPAYPGLPQAYYPPTPHQYAGGYQQAPSRPPVAPNERVAHRVIIGFLIFSLLFGTMAGPALLIAAVVGRRYEHPAAKPLIFAAVVMLLLTALMYANVIFIDQLSYAGGWISLCALILTWAMWHQYTKR